MKELKMFIAGKFIDNTSGKWINVLNPSTEKIIAKMPDGSVEDAQRGIDAAEKAQETWEKTPAAQRASYLIKIAKGIRKREKELTETIVKEGGKTFNLANTEVLFTADYLDYMAGWARRYEGEIIPSDRPNETIMLFKKAIGVTTGILPWNFPFFLIARKAAPALITGNTIVIKPSQLTPINAYIFAQIVEESGLPPGVFNLVNGRGSVVGSELASNSKVGMVSLTGSLEAGIQTMEAASKNITKVSLELGGKAPAIVLPDADLDLAVKSIVASRIINTGQVCNCVERVYVHKSIKSAFMEKLITAMKAVKAGDPSTIKDLDMGPLIDAKSLEAVQQKVKKAIRQGAKLVLGGNRIGTKGYFFEPTILDHVIQKNGYHSGRDIRACSSRGGIRTAGRSHHLGKRLPIWPDVFYLYTKPEYGIQIDPGAEIRRDIHQQGKFRSHAGIPRRMAQIRNRRCRRQTRSGRIPSDASCVSGNTAIKFL